MRSFHPRFALGAFSRWVGMTSLAGVAVAALTACGDDDKPTDTVDAVDTVDVADTDTTADVDNDTAADTTISYEKPEHFPDKADADEALSFANLSDHVRVVYDDRGIPHIYGKTDADVFFVQGFVTARDRIFQMHTLRSAAKGRLAEYAGTGSLSGDVYLRMLKLGRVAEQMAADTAANDPMLKAAMDAFTAGANEYLKRLRAGLEEKPPEVAVFGTDLLYDWSNVDTMAVVRLQTWDLGFGGIVDELTLWEVLTSLKETFAGTSLEGIELDVANFAPTDATATLEPEGGAKTVGTYDLAQVLEQPFFSKQSRRGWPAKIRKGFEALDQIPHRYFAGSKDGGPFGSNNWVVSGAHTQSGRPIVSNDTHLSLRNPAVFYHVHVSTKLAGGDLNAGGVNFAGAPGIVLGHNDHAAWGATVFYSDVTDMYVEKLNDDRSAVWYDGAWVNLEKRVETFRFPKPDEGECVDAAPAYVKNLEYTQSSEGFVCTVNVTVLDVPHHGPIIPWSFWQDGEDEYAVSWKWTGFESTPDLSAIARLNKVTDFASFKAALDFFSVGAQNWIYGGTDGDIGWYPSHNLPIRKHIAAGNTNFPPFLPMPGDTSDTAWTGFIPRAELPQSHNPTKGFLVTANADPTGTSFDNDPFNDGNYIGYTWAPGYRAGQATRRLKAKIDAGEKLGIDDMKSIQADHRSNLGADLTPVILEALTLAKGGTQPRAAAFIDADTDKAIALLGAWGNAGYIAASGVDDAVGSDMAKASAATAIFNSFLPFLLQNLAADEGGLGVDRLGNSMVGRFLWRLFKHPETMASYDSVAGTHPAWDNTTTTDVVETREEIIAKSLRQAVDFLKATDKVGPAQAGGFGTADMDQWRWGKLHTVTLRHNVAPGYNIPSPDVTPGGFPRSGDNFTVDACHPGFYDTNFTFSSGAAMRNVYDLTDTVVFHGVIPGGQHESPFRPHYQDEAALWSKNIAPKVAFTVEDILAAKQRTVDFVKAP